MKKTYLFIKSFALVLFLHVFAPSSLAQSPALSPTRMPTIPCPTGEIATDLGCLPQDPIGFVEKFYGIGMGLVGMVGLLFIVIGGYYIMTSQGNPAKLAVGKQFIFYSLAGITLAILGFVFIQIIAGDILRIPGFS